MKQLMLKFLILSVAWMGYVEANDLQYADVTIHYRIGNFHLTPISKHCACKAGVKWTAQDILLGAIDDLGFDEFAELSLCINGKQITPNSQFTLAQLKHSNIVVSYNPVENRPEKINQRRMAWLADQIVGEGKHLVWNRAISHFVENNYMDESGKLTSLKALPNYGTNDNSSQLDIQQEDNTPIKQYFCCKLETHFTSCGCEEHKVIYRHDDSNQSLFRCLTDIKLGLF
jgi:hypothetical protein